MPPRRRFFFLNRPSLVRYLLARHSLLVYSVLSPRYELNMHALAPIGDSKLSADLDIADPPPLWFLQSVHKRI